MRRWIAVLLVVGAAAGACKGGGDGTADPTVPTRATTSSSTPATAVPDISTIPPVIDTPYLNRVLEALDKVDTSAVRVIVETKNVSPLAVEILNSIYGDEWFNNVVSAWISVLEKDPMLSSIKQPPGNRRTTVQRLIALSPKCVWMAVTRDYSQTDVQPRALSTEYLALQPLDATNDPNHHNPTAWMITADGGRKDGTEPGNPCPTA